MPQYPHAPITEALVDLRVSFQHAVSLQDMKLFGAKVADDYPFENNREEIRAEFRTEPGSAAPSTSSSRTIVGFLYQSRDRKQAVQARINGFTFSRFTPYVNWNQLIDEAKRLWDIYLHVTRPTAVTRIAVRYINQLNLPLIDGRLRFDDYLNTLPQIGPTPEANHDLEEFFMRLVLPQNDLSAKLILTEALLPAQQPNKLGVILDFDLFREGIEIPVSSNDIWATLDTFRERKNLYFENSITNRARELFK